MYQIAGILDIRMENISGGLKTMPVILLNIKESFTLFGKDKTIIAGSMYGIKSSLNICLYQHT
jgi:hypothetical protein